ncbi:AAA family ATPase [Streptomyces cyaneofuscatus]|uniref:AAA family ATPase n=1 Tax=Streptomyces cyaneofuscatus TaxID=66883 RepID=UPI002F90A02B|nr:AAA family ATPase [Streptomyces cyaneofuscatus]
MIPFRSYGALSADATISDPALVCLIGAAGSGKSTLARRWWADSQVLGLDRFRAMVSDDAGCPQASGDAAFALQTVLEARLVRGLTSVIDATNTEAVHRGTLLNLARRYDVPTVALVVPTPLPICLERNARRPGNRRVPDVVVLRQHADVIAALPGLSREGFNRVLFADGHHHTESAGGSTRGQLVTG